ncbi:MAG: hypothetical protein HMLIMOIP_002577 [Candidatus Nitrosomirales archaeon]|jgi:hypothetical protein
MTVSIVPGERVTKEYLVRLEEIVNADINPVEYLGIDPGKSNGVCGYDNKYYLLFMLTIHADDMILFMHQFKKVKKCIIEDYKVYPNKAKDHIYSSLETPRVIGRIETWAKTNEVELIKQPASIKSTAYKWLGQEPLPKSNKMNHQVDAHAHFIYWGIKTGRIDIRSLIKK